jgi:hypothetical protein
MTETTTGKPTRSRAGQSQGPHRSAGLGNRFGNRSGVAFIGAYEHEANAQAVFWLARHIMPRVWAMKPDIVCLIVGPGWINGGLRRRDSRLRLIDRPVETKTILSHVRLTVAPFLRPAFGLQSWLLDSFAAGVPCVMSPVAARGLPGLPPLQSLVADGAEATARAILRLHSDACAHGAAALACRSILI